MKKNIVVMSVVLLGLSSCGGWSDEDKEEFMDSCIGQKYTQESCDCMLEKTMSEYGSFQEIADDQVGFSDKVLFHEDCFRAGKE